jgi:ankyrin repeat protein
MTMTKETIYAKDGTLKTKEALEKALQNGASPNEGWTALHEAVVGGRMDALELLAAHGADMDMMDGDGDTALIRACTTRNLTGQRRVSFIVRLIELGASVDHVNNQGDTALILAIKEEDDIPEALHALLRMGADPNTSNRWNKIPPLHFAHTPEAVTALLRHGADPKARDHDGKTAMERAPNQGPEIVQAFRAWEAGQSKSWLVAGLEKTLSEVEENRSLIPRKSKM